METYADKELLMRCRICTVKISSPHSETAHIKPGSAFACLIFRLFQITVLANDNLPKNICSVCMKAIKVIQVLQGIAKNSALFFQQELSKPLIDNIGTEHCYTSCVQSVEEAKIAEEIKKEAKKEEVRHLMCKYCDRKFSNPKVFFYHVSNHENFSGKQVLCKSDLEKEMDLKSEENVEFVNIAEEPEEVHEDEIIQTENIIDDSNILDEFLEFKNNESGDDFESTTQTQNVESTIQSKNVESPIQTTQKPKIKREKKKIVPETNNTELEIVDEANIKKEISFLTCMYCDKEFFSYNMLKKHENEHRNFKPQVQLKKNVISIKNVLSSEKKESVQLNVLQYAKSIPGITISKKSLAIDKIVGQSTPIIQKMNQNDSVQNTVPKLIKQPVIPDLMVPETTQNSFLNPKLPQIIPKIVQHLNVIPNLVHKQTVPNLVPNTSSQNPIQEIKIPTIDNISKNLPILKPNDPQKGWKFAQFLCLPNTTTSKPPTLLPLNFDPTNESDPIMEQLDDNESRESFSKVQITNVESNAQTFYENFIPSSKEQTHEPSTSGVGTSAGVVKKGHTLVPSNSGVGTSKVLKKQQIHKPPSSVVGTSVPSTSGFRTSDILKKDQIPSSSGVKTSDVVKKDQILSSSGVVTSDIMKPNILTRAKRIIKKKIHKYEDLPEKMTTFSSKNKDEKKSEISEENDIESLKMSAKPKETKTTNKISETTSKETNSSLEIDDHENVSEISEMKSVSDQTLMRKARKQIIEPTVEENKNDSESEDLILVYESETETQPSPPPQKRKRVRQYKNSTKKLKTSEEEEEEKRSPETLKNFTSPPENSALSPRVLLTRMKESEVQKITDNDNTQDITSVIKCGICFRHWNNYSLFVAHLNKQHLTAKVYPCTFCGEMLNSIENLNSHIKEHKVGNKYDPWNRHLICKKCNLRLPSKAQLASHIAKCFNVKKQINN